MSYNRKAPERGLAQPVDQQEMKQEYKAPTSLERQGFVKHSFDALLEFLGMFKEYFLHVYENPRLIITGILFLILALVILYVFHYLGMFLGYIIFDVILGKNQ